MKSLFFALVLSVSVCHADDWNGFRGPDTLGHGKGKFATNKWSNDIINKVALPGKGQSSPVVSKGLVFVTLASTQKDDKSNKQYLWLGAYQTSDLSRKWITRVGPVDDKGILPHPDAGLAASTVATDGKRIYVFNGWVHSSLSAFDFNGKQLWKTPLGESLHRFGSAASPAVHGDKVVIINDIEFGESFIAAYNVQTGAEIWKTKRSSLRTSQQEGRGSWGTPFFLTKEGKTVVIVNGGDSVRGAHERAGTFSGYDLKSGRLLWQIPGPHFCSVACPILSGKDLLISSSAAGLVALRWNGATEPQIVWRNTGGSYIPTPIAYKGRVYVANDNGVLSARDAQTGKRIWAHRLRGQQSGVRRGVHASLVQADGKLFVASLDGNVHVVDLEKSATECKIISTNFLGEDPIQATPALSNGSIYLRTNKHLIKVGSPRFVSP